jgi:uncharacterized membrane protein
MATSIERKWGAASHWIPVVANLLTWGLFGWAITLTIYLTQRRRSQFIGFHAYQSLFFQFALSVAILVGILLKGLWIGGPILVVAGLIGLIVPIIGAVHAARGEWWRNPIIGGRRSLNP